MVLDNLSFFPGLASPFIYDFNILLGLDSTGILIFFHPFNSNGPLGSSQFCMHVFYVLLGFFIHCVQTVTNYS